jgi:hypothetical protein
LHIGTLLNTRVSLTIIDRPKSSGPATSIDYIRAIIAANKVDNDMPILLAFSYKLRLVIGQKVEEGKTNSFYDGAFARSIGSTDSGGAPPEINDNLTIAFDILQLNACDKHTSAAFPTNNFRKENRVSPNSLFSPLEKKVEIVSLAAL